MKAYFRALLEALQAVAVTLQQVAQALELSDAQALKDRLQELEARQGAWEGEMEGQLVKVKSRFDAVRAAEERIRHASKKAAEDGDPDEADFSPEALAQIQAGFQNGHAQGGGEEGLQPVHPGVEVDPRAALKARKFGRA